MSKLTIDVDLHYSVKAIRDVEIPSFCINELEALQLGKTSTVYVVQELVLYMFRALLFREYKHLQEQVTFLLDGVEVKFDHRMRTNEDNYPHSLYNECLCILLGATDE